jgi:hypothetical protein
MIEIKPTLATHPIKKITKIIRERHRPPEQNKTQEHKNEAEGEDDDSSNEPDQQHIDEIV